MRSRAATAALLLTLIMKLQNYVLAFCSAMYAVVLLAWFSLQPVPALQDFLEWVFQSWAFGRLLAGDPAYSVHFSLVHYPVPNMFAQLFMAGVSAFASPFVAAKIFIACYICFGALVCYRLARRFAPNAAVPAFVLLLGLAVFNACFWHGYVNYQISLLLILFYVDLTAETRPTVPLVFVFGLLLFCCHASMFAAFGLLVLLREWRRPGRMSIYASLLPGVALLALYFIRRPGHNPSHGVATQTLLSHLAYKGYTIAKAGPFHNLVIADGTSATRWHSLYKTGVALNFGFAVVLLALVVSSWPHLYAKLKDRPERWIYLGVLASLFLLLPSDIAEVVNLGERFLYLLALLLIFDLASSRWLPVLAWLTIAGFALTLVQIPAASLHGTSAPEAFHQPPGREGRAYAQDGLFSHRLYQNDERRIELRVPGTPLDPLLFDTGLLSNKP
ncbi:MAG TPA: hypothetical protein VGD59_04030 [Acidisarcina sp.]